MNIFFCISYLLPLTDNRSEDLTALSVFSWVQKRFTSLLVYPLFNEFFIMLCLYLKITHQVFRSLFLVFCIYLQTFFFRNNQWRWFEHSHLQNSPAAMCSVLSKPDWPVVHHTSTTLLALCISVSSSEKGKWVFIHVFRIN